MSGKLKSIHILAVMFFLLIGINACDPRQVVLVKLESRPQEASSMGVYFQHASTGWKSFSVPGDSDQFGIEFPVGIAGNFQVKAHMYANNVPCSIGSAAGVTSLAGKYRQDLTMSVARSTQSCRAGTEQPFADATTQGPLAVFAASEKDLWLVGRGGLILRWDGSRYTQVPLPASLSAFPPDWNTVVGTTRGEILIAGTKGTVLRFAPASGILEPLSIVPPPGVLLTSLRWNQASVSDPSLGDVWFAGTGGLVGYYNPGSGSFVSTIRLLESGGATVNVDINAVSCAITNRPNGKLYDCFFVGNGGTLLRYKSGAGPNCVSLASGTTNDLTGVAIIANMSTMLYDVRVVGRGRTLLRGTAPLNDTLPVPMFTSYDKYLPQGLIVDFGAIQADAKNGAWISGDKGSLLYWSYTPAIPGSEIPFTMKATQLIDNISGLSVVGDGVFMSGANNLISYTGPLFTPMP